MVKTLRKWLPDAIVVLAFVAISFAYFFPADIEGRILYRHDSSAGRGSGQELSEYYQRTGETTRWTGSLFSGMPTYQMAPAYKSLKVLDQVRDAYHLWLPDYVWYLFAYLLGFYILLRAFDFKQMLAALGSLIWAFSTYFVIIIAAGHYWKVMALAYLPPMIAGMVVAYRGHYLRGLALVAIFTALEVQANHVQMTYYYLMVILALIVAFLVDAIREKRYAHFLKATAVCLAGALIGVLINISNLYHTWEYSKESMRGKSELVKADAANQTSNGLDRDYITQWSYGVGETWTLLVPNAKGGASVPLSQNAIGMKHADNNYRPIYQQLGQYWGSQPGTSGPVYVGAFVVMLFIFGLFIVKGPMKWALLAATLLSIMLSWGKNFMGLTNLFLDHVPMYAKFRTVASILVVAEFCIPLLAMMALKNIMDDPQLLKRKLKYLYISLALTAGPCLLFALMPGLCFGNLVSPSEMAALAGWPQEHLAPLLNNLNEVRRAILSADCWRSLWIILLGTMILLLMRAGKLKKAYAILGIAALCLIDLWAINKRYLNDGMFVDKQVKTGPVRQTATEQAILQDKQLGYRVLNLATNTFNENETSYYLKSIGGYHPAKLRRYQELIDAHIAPEMQRIMPAITQSQANLLAVNGDSLFPILNMLNAKYFILPLQGGQTAPIQNPYAMGAAWVVDNIEYVDNANEEIDAIGRADLRTTAIVDKRWADALAPAAASPDSRRDGPLRPSAPAENHVEMTSYEPNRLTYDVNTSNGGVLVFSEVFYPGWRATVDGKEVPVARANYVLRAIRIEAGHHEVKLSFFPKTVDTTEAIASVAYLLLLAAVGLAIWNEWRNRKKKKAQEPDK